MPCQCRYPIPSSLFTGSKVNRTAKNGQKMGFFAAFSFTTGFGSRIIGVTEKVKHFLIILFLPLKSAKNSGGFYGRS
jgi:hypothetical protein